MLALPIIQRAVEKTPGEAYGGPPTSALTIPCATRGSERETERERERETERRRDGETERQSDRETERQRDRETDPWGSDGEGRRQSLGGCAVCLRFRFRGLGFRV